jgi:phosphoribosyl-ATP pyrophosphohydrolase
LIVPSIDLMGGRAVQLVGGETLAIDAGDPRPIAERFAVAGEIAVIDLDAARGEGSNRGMIEELCRLAPCRVGGGIRDVDAALRWLDAGARKVILGTAARPDVLSALPPERVIAALDARDGDVVTHGWRTGTGTTIQQRMAELHALVGGFLVTFVELEGRMGGTNAALAEELRALCGVGRTLTIAGGVTTAADVATLDRLGCDAQVGMALYSGRMDLGDAVAAPLRTDRPDGLWPTVVCDEGGVALGLVYSSAESIRQAVRTRRGVYYSRSRGGLWEKGATSGATQELLRVDVDCDRDTLRFTVRQRGTGFCHNGTASCWGPSAGVRAAEDRVATSGARAHPASYTARLLQEPGLLGAKLREEADELARAQHASEVTHEAADLMYFTLVAMHRAGVRLADVAQELDRRGLKVSRRPGDAKPGFKRDANGGQR